MVQVVTLWSAFRVVDQRSSPRHPQSGNDQVCGSILKDMSTLVDIISGSFGAGHDAAAAALAEQFDEIGVQTRTWDIVDLFRGGLGRFLRTAYLRQVQSAPASWRWLLNRLESGPKASSLITSALTRSATAVLDIASDRPDLILSTHPFASQALGSLRAQARVDVPVATYLTDMSVHPLWVHPGVDRHFAIHSSAAQAALTRGARNVTVVQPAVAKRFHRRERAPRQQWGLPEGPVALVTGGAWGVGQLGRSAADIAATGLAQPVVLCGSNDRLRRRLERQGIRGLGWVDDVAQLLSSVDVVVQNAGGMTTLEARSIGVPTITYRCLPGHGETNAAALHEAGLATWARSPDQLPWVLSQALRAPSHQVATTQTVAATLYRQAALTA